MNRKQRRAALKQDRNAAPAGRPAPSAAVADGPLFASALRHHQAGRLDEAEALYRQILAGNPAHTECLQNLGVIGIARGRSDAAIDLLRRAIAINPGLVAAHVNLGALFSTLGRAEEAIECYLRAIELAPDALEVHNSLCALLLARGQHDAVASHIEQVLAFRPDFVAGHNTLAAARLAAGDAARALDAVRTALTIRETPESKALFVLCLNGMPSIAGCGDLHDLLIRAMSEPWGRPANLTRHCIALIRSDGAIADGIDRAMVAWPERLTPDRLFGPTGLAAASQNAVLRCLLESTSIDSVPLERYLTSVRLALLDAAAAACADDVPDDAMLAFYCALARQCFINEYVYAQTEPEVARFEALRDSLAAALRIHAPVPLLWPVAVAAYASLDTLPERDALLRRDWPAALDAVLTQQLREPATERRLRDAIPRLTPIADRVSIEVQDQYEQNPYPRWVKAAPGARPTDIDVHLRTRFPFSRFRNLGRTAAVEILVAGCGTGQQLVDVAQRFTSARVLAIDLSLASLAYAKRQTDAIGLRNIEYAQADILGLGGLDRSFDVIDCGGVLHHLGDPLAGWRVLNSLLRPDGAMRIALYSELARRHVVAAREVVAARRYGRTADDIRRFRQDVLALPDGDIVKLVVQSPNFFSISDCRDLIFHVQEHRFSLPEIRAFLAAAGLEFLGFDIDTSILSRYSARHPDDRARTDLGRWHEFERSEPWTFGAMYQFWVQKRQPPSP
jgi:SAM-dependent methyltransferase/Tfp pilus assembly protein PilF